MKTINTKLIIVSLIFLPFVSHARLGDTLQALTNRLGDGVTITGPIKDIVPDAYGYFFEKSGIKEVVTFYRGVSVSEHYLKLGDDATFSQEEVKTILANNNLGGHWDIGFSVAGITRLVWKPAGYVPDGYDSNPAMEGTWSGGLVTIGTKKYLADWKAASAAKDQNKLHGF